MAIACADCAIVLVNFGCFFTLSFCLWMFSENLLLTGANYLPFIARLFRSISDEPTLLERQDEKNA